MKSGILSITHRVPWPPDRGDRIRTWNILKFLSSRTDVDLACLADEPVSQETIAELQKVTRRLAIIPHNGPARYAKGLISAASGGTITEGMFHSSLMNRTLRQWSREHGWNAALASSSGMAALLSPTMIGKVDRRWVDLMDVDSEKWFDYSQRSGFLKSLIYRTEGHRLRNVETRLAEELDRLVVVSDAEVQVFRKFCDSPRIQSVPNGVDTDYFGTDGSTDRKPFSCVFVGVMNYLPNVDAVRWFVTEVWPHVKKRHPEAVFRIVGKSPTVEVMELGSVPGVEVIGPVADVRPWLHQSTCTVVPLRIARGIQNKVLEAMACGRPVICSPAPLKGIAAVPGRHLLCADSAEEWVEAVSRVFRDSCLQEELGILALEWVRQHHCWDARLQPFLELTQNDRDLGATAHRGMVQGITAGQSEAVL